MSKQGAKRRARNRNQTKASLAPKLIKEAQLLNDLELTESEITSVPEDCEDDKLVSAKTYWFFGEWLKLAEFDVGVLQNHPERDSIALLVASAHQQLGEHDNARKLIRIALDWGCPKRVAAQILIAGVHNTLGRIAALTEDEPRIAHHFEAAVSVTGATGKALVSHARSVREMARMGLLPQAASLVDKELLAIKTNDIRPRQQAAHINVLQSEMEMLHQELSLAQQRQQLFRSPVEPDLQGPEPNTAEWVEGLKKRSVSQLGQDLWVLEQTGYKRNGFFVEFGATDGVILSNSWLLEKEFGWNGICAEPNPKYFEKLQNNRNCIVDDACIAAQSGINVDFIMADEFGTMSNYKDTDLHAERRNAYAEVSEPISLETISLNDFLIKNNAPKEIDYLSIDTEGSEYDILKSFPFDMWKIRHLTVEHNFGPTRGNIKNLLCSYGYTRIEAQWDDWYVLKP